MKWGIDAVPAPAGKNMADSGVIALVPMKGHSERVPGKNLRDLNGKPLYHWIVESLKRCRYVKKIVINTDSEEIAGDISQNFNDITVIRRPGHICGDHISANEIIAYDLTQVGGEHFLQTHSTNPLLDHSTINGAVEAYFGGLEEYDSLFSVNCLRTRLYRADGGEINHDPEKLARTQDLQPVYEENSNIYLFSRSSFIPCGRRIGRRPQMFMMDRLEAVDIDEEQDFRLAEMLVRYKAGCGR